MARRRGQDGIQRFDRQPVPKFVQPPDPPDCDGLHINYDMEGDLQAAMDRLELVTVSLR